MNEEKTINGIISGSIGCTILGKLFCSCRVRMQLLRILMRKKKQRETEAEDKDTTAKKKENLKTVGEKKDGCIAFKLRNATSKKIIRTCDQDC